MRKGFTEKASQKRLHRKGFTLIELLVVISIIALLLSILMPSLQKVKEQARTVVCATQLRQFGMASNMYCEDNNGRFSHGWGGVTSTTGNVGDSWVPKMAPYTSNSKELRICPSAKMGAPDPESSTNANLGNTATSWVWVWGDWQEQNNVHHLDATSYTWNGWCSNPDSGLKWFQQTTYLTRKAFGNPYVSQSSKIPLMGDGRAMYAWPQDTDPPMEYEDIMSSGGTGWGMNVFSMNRHGKGMNIVFLDNSVNRVGTKELWKLKWNNEFDASGNYTDRGGMIESQWPGWIK